MEIKMYGEKLEPILNDLEDKEVEIAGGSVVGMVLATVNSLIKYISNLTLGKKKYEDVQVKVEEILKMANDLKIEAIQVVDKDREVLEVILKAYKVRKEYETQYEKVCKEAVEFCMQVVEIAFKTLKLSDEISKVGNKMLASDFKICKYYSFASVQSAIVNVDINLGAIEDNEYKDNIRKKCNKILESARNI
jgi:formiminotetrahydrofolate cyclodeaminase